VTAIRVAFVDTLVLRGAGTTLQVLLLRRAPHGRNPGSWETVHGTIEEGETPVQASLRELREETGLTPDRFYNLSRIEGFYQHKSDELVIIPAFAAFVAADTLPLLSREHDAFVWLGPRDAAKRFAWPRERRALEDVLSIVGSGGGGLLDDVLRVS
jgi:8-oxo-dGTP pyrophosphatase MutT (NUDIX family)